MSFRFLISTGFRLAGALFLLTPNPLWCIGYTEMAASSVACKSIGTLLSNTCSGYLTCLARRARPPCFEFATICWLILTLLLDSSILTSMLSFEGSCCFCYLLLSFEVTRIRGASFRLVLSGFYTDAKLILEVGVCLYLWVFRTEDRFDSISMSRWVFANGRLGESFFSLTGVIDLVRNPLSPKLWSCVSIGRSAFTLIVSLITDSGSLKVGTVAVITCSGVLFNAKWFSWVYPALETSLFSCSTSCSDSSWVL